MTCTEPPVSPCFASFCRVLLSAVLPLQKKKGMLRDTRAADETLVPVRRVIPVKEAYYTATNSKRCLVSIPLRARRKGSLATVNEEGRLTPRQRYKVGSHK